MLSSVDSTTAQLLLDADQLVVLREPLGAAGSSCLDMASRETHNQVGNEAVLGLTRSVRDKYSPSVVLAHLVGLDGLSDGADLVDLQQQGVAGLLLDGSSNPHLVGHQEVVTHNLVVLAQRTGQFLESCPIFLVVGVFNQNHIVVLGVRLVFGLQLGCSHMGHLLRQLLVLEVQIVFVISLVVELRSCAVDTQLDNIGVSCGVDGLM